MFGEPTAKAGEKFTTKSAWNTMAEERGLNWRLAETKQW
jgi:hypothetical protein